MSLNFFKTYWGLLLRTDLGLKYMLEAADTARLADGTYALACICFKTVHALAERVGALVPWKIILVASTKSSVVNYVASVLSKAQGSTRGWTSRFYSGQKVEEWCEYWWTLIHRIRDKQTQ